MLNKFLFQIHWRIREFIERVNIYAGTTFILVYTMGKVGSTSVYFSLKKKFGGKVVFIHRTDEVNIEEYNAPFEKNNLKTNRTSLAKFVKRKLIDEQKKLKIITLIREPIQRNISCFFQDFRAYNNGKEFHEVTIDEAINNFLKNYPHDMMDKWFEREFFSTLNLEMEDISFNTTKKTGLVQKGNYTIILLRSDLGNDEKADFLGQVLETNGLSIGFNNAHSKKEYQSYYLSFINSLKIPDTILQTVYSSPLLNVFYNSHELKTLKTKWTK